MIYPICDIYNEIKGQNSSKKGLSGMKFYHSLEILTDEAIQKNVVFLLML
jgi:hypothetical protein